MLVMTKLNGRKDFILRGLVYDIKEGITYSELATEARH